MKNKTKNPTLIHQPANRDTKQPFIEHVNELRRRLIFIALSVCAFSVAGYFIQQQLIAWLLKPSHGQQFIYTTPVGGLNFLFQVCVYFGLLASIPIIFYQILRYIEPLITYHAKRSILFFGVCSVFLAGCGVAFGYFIGLPVALNFLGHQFVSAQITPLLTVQDYFNFVTIYLLGSALLFQIPLILLVINRISPLSPRRLLSFERYYIALAFIVAAILTPTPDVFNQLLFVAPILAVYQVGILLIFLKNRYSRRAEAAQVHQPAEVPETGLGENKPLKLPVVQLQAAKPVIRRLSQPGGRIWDIA